MATLPAADRCSLGERAALDGRAEHAGARITETRTKVSATRRIDPPPVSSSGRIPHASPITPSDPREARWTTQAIPAAGPPRTPIATTPRRSTASPRLAVRHRRSLGAIPASSVGRPSLLEIDPPRAGQGHTQLLAGSDHH